MKKRIMNRKYFTFCFITLCLSSSLLFNCAVKPKMEVAYYPTCYSPIDYLYDSQNDLVKDVAKKSALGALAGAGTGALTAAISGGDKNDIAKGAAIGGVVGGVGAGVVAYISGKQQQIKDDQARYASYCDDMKSDIASADRVSTFANQSRDCYKKEFTNLIADVKLGKFTKETGQKRFDEIKRGMIIVADILGQAEQSLSDKEQQYAAALVDEARKKNMTDDQIQAIKTSDKVPPQNITEVTKSDKQEKSTSKGKGKGKSDKKSKTVAQSKNKKSQNVAQIKKEPEVRTQTEFNKGLGEMPSYTTKVAGKIVTLREDKNNTKAEAQNMEDEFAGAMTMSYLDEIFQFIKYMMS